MSTILNFETLAEFSKVKNGLVAPCIARIVNGSKVISATKVVGEKDFTYTCNGKTCTMSGEIDEVGQIVVVAPNGDKVLVHPKDYKGIEGTPIGVVVVPSSHTEDGHARFISLKNMSLTNPEEGTSGYEYMYWGYNNQSVLNPMTEVRTVDIDNPEDGSYGTNSYGMSKFDFGGSELITEEETEEGEDGEYVSYRYYEFYKNGWGNKYANAYFTEDGEFDYSDEFGIDGSYVISPYKEDGSKNEDFFDDYAQSDMNGKENTDIVFNNYAQYGKNGGVIENNYQQGHYPAFVACKRYKTNGTESGEWYLPAFGELLHLFAKFKQINDALKVVGGGIEYGMNGRVIWSSTEFSASRSWGCYTGIGNCNNLRKHNFFSARAFHAL